MFKPVLPILRCSSLSKVVSRIATHPGPLTLCVFARDRSIRGRVLDDVSFKKKYVGSAICRLDSPCLPFKKMKRDKVKTCRNGKDFSIFSRRGDVLGRAAGFSLPFQCPAAGSTLGGIGLFVGWPSCFTEQFFCTLFFKNLDPLFGSYVTTSIFFREFLMCNRARGMKGLVFFAFLIDFFVKVDPFCLCCVSPSVRRR